MADPISEAFEHLESEADRRGTRRVKLSSGRRQARAASGLADDGGAHVPGLPEAEPKKRWSTWIPTGPDGYPVGRSLEVDTIGQLLGREIRRRGWVRELAGGWVTGNWEQLVGPKIAQHTKVDMIKANTLFITCDTTAWATNLRLMQTKILSQIATKVGPDVIVRLKINGPNVPSWRKGRLHVKGRGPRDTYG